jgi:hypothetical protein
VFGFGIEMFGNQSAEAEVFINLMILLYLRDLVAKRCPMKKERRL